MSPNRFTLFLFFILSFNYKNSEALECIEGSSVQKHMTGCAEKELAEETKKLDGAYKDYIKFLGDEDYRADEKKYFKESHIAWIKYKDLYCKNWTASCQGGSICGLVWASCQTTKTRQRLQEIEEIFEDKKRL
jgi:uncharacterized protein YecT (DUF1311 family)